MIKTYIIQAVISEMLKQYSLTKDEIELAKVELRYKSNRELENLFEKLEELNQ